MAHRARMRTAIRYLAYPVIVIGGATFLIAALSAGVPPWQVGPPLLVVAAVLCTRRSNLIGAANSRIRTASRSIGREAS